MLAPSGVRTPSASPKATLGVTDASEIVHPQPELERHAAFERQTGDADERGAVAAEARIARLRNLPLGSRSFPLCSGIPLDVARGARANTIGWTPKISLLIGGNRIRW
jgi:hypothetical protein